MAKGAVRVILSDHHYWGGLAASRDLGRICEIWGLGLSMHSNSHLGISLAAMTHLAAATPNLTYDCDTHAPWQTAEVIDSDRSRVFPQAENRLHAQKALLLLLLGGA